MNERKDPRGGLQDRIGKLLKKLQMEQERKPLRLAQWMGSLFYVRLFVESQKRESLQPYFPYAGFPMEWSRGDEVMELQQRVWQLEYQVQYCSSIVEEGHFMEKARTSEKGEWSEELCKFIDEIAEQADWSQGMPVIFGAALEEMIRQIYGLGNSGLFLMPDPLIEMVIALSGEKKRENVWNPSCRTGAFLAASHRAHPEWKMEGSEQEKDLCLLAQMLSFFYGFGIGGVCRENPLEAEKGKYDLIISNPPVGELESENQDRFSVSTRKIQLQYLQMIMEHLKQQGMAIVVVNEGTLFKFDAEMRVRQELLENYALQGVISLPAGAFLPYTGSKASILIFENTGEAVEAKSLVWFYELHHLGYSLDRRREVIETNEIPSLLESWKERKNLEKEWETQLARSSCKNQWENPVPEEWNHGSFWFADGETIRKNDYNLTAGRYKPWKEEGEEVLESPLELLEQLASLEKETMNSIQELIEMTKNYG